VTIFRPKIEEFVAIWFESTQEWVVMFPDGTSIRNGFGAVGYAVNAALEYLSRGEVEFDVTEDTGTFYRYQKCAEFWQEAS
jgi:hypothetical protein